jgi:hypothetical protein
MWFQYFVSKPKIQPQSNLIELNDNKPNINYHLIFHIHCINHEKVYYAIAKLKNSLRIFNGYKILTVSTPDNRFHNNEIFQKIVDDLYDPNTFIIPVINTHEKKESSHFFLNSAPVLRSLLLNNDEKNFVFFGHSKGCSHPEKDYAVTCWVNTLWKYNIDLFYNLVKPKIESGQHDFIGCIRTTDEEHLDSSFHYAGTFFWFDAKLLKTDSWFKPYDHLLSLEMWPGLISDISKSICLFDPGSGNKYRFDFWYNLVFAKIIDRPHTLE